MRQLMDGNFRDESTDALNKGLFTFASYNAGAGAVGGLVERPRGGDATRMSGSAMSSRSRPSESAARPSCQQHLQVLRAYRLIVEENERRSAAKETGKTAGKRK